MTTIEETTSPDVDERIERHMTEWQRLSALAQAEMAAAIALISGRPAPADRQVLRFATQLQRGDHVQRGDGWWLVHDVRLGDDQGDAVLTLHRVGFVPMVLPLAGNDVFLSVRPGDGA